MKLANQFRLLEAALLVTSAFLIPAAPVLAQDYPPPPSFSSGQLDNLVSRIALYPDPLLAQVLAAASFPDQIRDAAQWAGQNRNLRGDELANAMGQANLPFDPAVQALIPFPTVLDMLAADLNWTSNLGNAVLANQAAVMDAVQRMRQTAEQYGYLQSNQQERVTDTGYGVEIQPVDPSLIYVPAYDPYIVYARPRPGFFVGGAIGFTAGFSIGAFDRWGWGGGFNWNNHSLVVNHSAWGRNWNNRDAYVHNYGSWDRGQSRNDYRRAETRTDSRSDVRGTVRSDNAAQYRNGFANSRYDTRGAQSTPAAPSRSYQRDSSPQFRTASPVTPSRNYDRSSASPTYRAAPQAQSFAGTHSRTEGHAERSFNGRR